MEWIRHGLETWGPSSSVHPPSLVTRTAQISATFLKEEISKIILDGVMFRPVEYSRYISRAFLVPKPLDSGWRMIIDLREITVTARQEE
jgi:hypothetical protein